MRGGVLRVLRVLRVVRVVRVVYARASTCVRHPNRIPLCFAPSTRVFFLAPCSAVIRSWQAHGAAP